MAITRRSWLAAGVASLAPQVGAQVRPPKVVVASFVGDKIEVVGAAMETGSRLNQNSRFDVNDRENTFDKLVLAAVADGLSVSMPLAEVITLVVPASRLHDEPGLMLRADGVALPGAVVDIVERQRATHVVLVTKLSSDASFKLQQTNVGQGRVRGLGFYVDHERELIDVDTGRTTRGFIGPYASVRLSLIDAAQGTVVGEKLVRASRVVTIANRQNATHPWEALAPQEKVEAIADLIRRDVRLAAQGLDINR